MAYSERLPTLLNPFAERTCFSQVGETFFIVAQGEVDADEGGDGSIDARLYLGDHFGEDAIDSDEVERYEATYIAAVDGTECFTIDKATFQEATAKNLAAFGELKGVPKEGDIDALIDAIDQDGDGTFSRAEVPSRGWQRGKITGKSEK